MLVFLSYDSFKHEKFQTPIAISVHAMRANLHLSAEKCSDQYIIVAILTPEQLLRPNILFFSSTIRYNYFCTIT